MSADGAAPFAEVTAVALVEAVKRAARDLQALTLALAAALPSSPRGRRLG
jgi:hypothetical protein